MISVFTPSHNPRFLPDCWESLAAQTYSDWEWVVLLSGQCPPKAATELRRLAKGARLTLRRSDDAIEGVGAAKRAAVELCKGEILVELDHDDMLASTALERVAEAFAAHPDAGLVYSHAAQVDESGKRDDSKFDVSYGWEYREANIDGLSVQYAVSLQPTPHNVSLIWFAPNHLRAFTRKAYDAAGGYDPGRKICDDADLISRLYRVGPFHLIDEPLYLQRIWPGNSQREAATNKAIQVETVRIYERDIEQNCLAWCRRSGLLALDLGSHGARRPGFLGVDHRPGPGVDLVCELPGPLPLAEGSAGVVRACDFLEHVADKVALINEIYRVLAPGGMLLSLTPSTDGRGAFQDPTHCAFYNEQSFWYYSDWQFQRFVPDVTARFQVSRLATGFPSEWHRHHNIPYVWANLIALKPGMPRYGGRVLWR